ncbi:hypothetical protein [Bradyrhizobium sp. JR18.2]|uniref:hypothetical protein n=1 Tax=Bradyrhizobium sp. JR18.2 TaxID=3156369 RepID=UPI003395E39A
MEREIYLVRYRLGAILDRLHSGSEIDRTEARLMIEDKLRPTIRTIHFRRALKANYDRLKVLDPVEADEIFDEEVRRSILRWERFAKIEREAKEEVRYLLPFACVRQEAVGHGGFHTGAMGFYTPQFRWIYDCGAWRKKSALSNRIQDFIKRCRADLRLPDVDALFLSHFDADHVNGLEELLEGSAGFPTTVKMVVAPYLSPREVVATIGRAVEAGRDSADLIRAVADPAGYFGDKGIETLVLVRPDGPPPSSPDGPGRGPTLPTTYPPYGDRLALAFFNPDGKSIILDPPEEGKIHVMVADPGSFFEVTSYGRALDWIFVPHAHEWRLNREKIADECRRILKLDPDAPGFNQALIEKLRTRVGLNDVKKLYCGMNSNGTSMSLYAGPRTSAPGRVVYRKKSRSTGYAATRDVPGWLLTGDAPLNRRDAFAQWKGSFEPVASLTGHMMLPHHGAERNFNKSLISYAHAAKPFLTVDRDDYVARKRPPQKVRAAIKRRLVPVTERKSLVEVSGPSEGISRIDDVSRW